MDDWFEMDMQGIRAYEAETASMLAAIANPNAGVSKDTQIDPEEKNVVATSYWPLDSELRSIQLVAQKYVSWAFN